MNGILQYSTLSRLLDLNNQVHDLKYRMMEEPVLATTGSGQASRIAEMQEEIERRTRASLSLCWLADPSDEQLEEEGFEY
jgi:hypothetical protein